MGRWPFLPWALGTTMLAVSAASRGGAGANLLPNPSFEAEEAGGPTAWHSRAWAGAEHCAWAIGSPGRTGARCVSIRSDQGADAAWTTTVPVRPDRLYRLSGWIRTQAVRGAVGALLNLQNMQHVRTPRVRGTVGWTRVAVDFRTRTEDHIEVNCLFGGWGSATGQAWYDDLVLEEMTGMNTSPQATVTVNAGASLTPYSPMFFGGFLEHFDGQVYGGVFDPGSPLADAPLQGRYPATVLAGDSPDAYNDVDHPDRVTPQTVEVEFAAGKVALPPHSLTIVAVGPRDGG